MFCEYCAEELDDGAKFCSRCGKAQREPDPATQDAPQQAGDDASGKPVCAACGKALERGWTLCPFCGTALNAEPALNANSVSAPEPEKAGLYDGDEFKGPMDLMDALDWIIAEAIDGGNYCIVLGKDEAIPYAILDCKGKHISVSLKGSGPIRTVRWKSVLDRALFAVHSGVTFTLEEGVALEGMPESENENKSSVVVVYEEGTFNMNGGSISGNSTEGFGAGVFVEGGTFTMSGGTISGNSVNMRNGKGFFGNSGGTGGGVYVNDGMFTMSGGTIKGNSANIGGGGGVFVESGTFVMSGGTINGNSANMSNGGGVFVNGGTFTMSGGTISGNSSIGHIVSGYGGGVYVKEGTTFIKSKGSIIYGSNAPMEQANTAAERGAAVYHGSVYGSGWERDTTARINTVMDSTKDGSEGGWE